MKMYEFLILQICNPQRKYMNILRMLFSVTFAYLTGCVNAALIYSKLIKHTDIRSYGSGNAGSTNVLRIYGLKPALCVFLFDCLKGFAAVKAAAFINTAQACPLAVSVCAVAVVCGHNWPIFTQYRGGKGVATTFGAGLALVPEVALCALGLAIALVLITKIVSVGTVGAVCSAALWIIITKHPLYECATFAALAVLCVWRHAENIKRILNGTENKLEF